MNARQLTDYIFEAIKNNEPKKIEPAFVQGADLKLTNAENYTPLIEAGRWQRWECVQAIANARKTDATTDGYAGSAGFGAALMYAAHFKQIATVRILIAAGASLAWYSLAEKYTALHWAVKNKDIELLKLLLEHKASLTAVDMVGKTPIDLAIELKWWDGWAALINGIDPVEKRLTLLFEQLQQAIKRGDKDAERAIIEHLSPRELTDYIFEAIKNNEPKKIEPAIVQAADLKLRNAAGFTPFMEAGRFQRWDCVDALSAVAKTDAETDGISPTSLGLGAALNDAAHYQQIRTIQELLLAGASTTWHTLNEEYTPLHWAVKNQSIALLNLLLEHKANVTVDDKEGKTPIDLAIELKWWDGWAALMNTIQPIEERQKLTLEQLQKALKNGNKETVQTIVKDLPSVMLVAISKLLYRSLTQNSFKTEEINDQIELLEQLDHAALKKLLIQVKEEGSKKDSLSKAGHDCEVLITSVQTLLNYPDVKPPIHMLQSQKHEGAKRVFGIMERREGINTYCNNIKARLIEIQSHALGVFKVKSYFTRGEDWKDGVPDHVLQLRKCLAKLTVATKLSEALKMYHEVEQMLATIKPSEDRHSSTEMFYSNALKSLHSITFLSPAALEQSFAMPPLPLKGSLLDLSTIPMQHSLPLTLFSVPQGVQVPLPVHVQTLVPPAPAVSQDPPPYSMRSNYKSTLFADMPATVNPEATLVLPDVPTHTVRLEDAAPIRVGLPAS